MAEFGLDHETAVELKLLRRPDKSLYWQIKVRSAEQTRRKLIGTVESGTKRERYKIGVCAAALAEQLHENKTKAGLILPIRRKGQSESIDPGAVALAAERAYDKIKAQQGAPSMGNEPPRKSGPFSK